MKIGIVTFHDAHNFGAMLQSYGLQHTLQELGAQSCFLDFPVTKAPAETPSSPLMQRILQHREHRQALFSQFRKTYLNCAPFDGSQTKNYDLFVAGSDQVWNPEITAGAGKYLLTFAPANKRCAYAASFGTPELPENCKAYFAKELKQFRHISVREKSGIDLVQKLTGMPACVNIDPSMLVEASRWEQMMAKPKTDTPYLLLITVQNDMNLLRLATQIAQDRGLELKVISASFFPPLGFQPWSDVSVTDWLRMVHDAQAVISSSFHGLVFSILFHKEFYSNPLVSGLADRNSRVTELMETLGIPERPAGVAAEPVDWAQVDSRLAALRTDAKTYLKTLVEGL